MTDLPAWITARLATPSGVQLRTPYRVGPDDRPLLAFGQHRPLTGQEKLWGFTGDLTHTPVLLAEVEGQVRADGGVSVKVELTHDDVTLPPLLEAAGYVRLAPPVIAAPFPHDPAAVPQGWVKRLAPGPAPRELGYFRQTTNVTCGAASAQMALAALGLAEPSRDAELRFWRDATYLPGIEPFGLAVGLAGRGAHPRVVADYDGAILLEDATEPWQRELREYVQAGFRRDAAALGVPVERRRFDSAELVDRVTEGRIALVLIDEWPMHDEHCPHWIVVHGRLGDHLLVDDPWTDDTMGETWVDAHELPLHPSDLDRLAQFGDPPYRALVTL